MKIKIKGKNNTYNTQHHPNLDDAVQVAVGVLYVKQDGQERYLVARRRQDQHQGGKLEFVGGKVEQTEQPISALVREVDEELGLDVRACPTKKMGWICHHYTDKTVVLWVYAVLLTEVEADSDALKGDVGKLGQALYWLTLDELIAQRHHFPEANRVIFDWLNLPEVLVISHSLTQDGAASLSSVDWLGCYQRLDHTAWLSVRTGLDAKQTCQLLKQLCDLYDPPRLVVPESVYRHALHEADALLQQVVAVRLTHDALMMPKGSWRDLRQMPLIISCHDKASVDQVNALVMAGFRVLAITLSPVKATLSHPEAVPLGWTTFEHLAQRSAVPVYALGGLSPEDLTMAWHHGAYGVAGIRRMVGRDRGV